MMVREEAPPPLQRARAAAPDFSVSAAADDSQVALVVDLSLEEALHNADKRRMPTGRNGNGRERKAVIDAADPKDNLTFSKTKGVNAMENGEEEPEGGANPPSANVPAPDYKEAFKVDHKEAPNRQGAEPSTKPTAGVTFIDLKQSDKYGEANKFMNKKGDNLMDNGGQPKAGTYPYAKVNCPNLKEAFKVEEKAENCKEGLVINVEIKEGPKLGTNCFSGVTVSNLKETISVEKESDKYGEVYKFMNKKGDNLMDNGRKPKAGTYPYAKVNCPNLKEAFKVKEKTDTCGEGFVISVENKEGPELSANCLSGVTVSNLKEAFKVEKEADNFGVVLKSTNNKSNNSRSNGGEPKAGTSAEVNCPDLKEAFKVEKEAEKCGLGLMIKERPEPGANCFSGFTIPDQKGGLTFEEMKSDKFGQESFKLEKEDKCGEELVVKTSSEGLEQKKEGLELKASASSASTNSDLTGAAARVGAATTKVLEYGSKSNASMVKTSLSDLRKLISEVNIAQERADASRAEDPNPDLTREQNAAAASELFKVDNICLPPFSTRLRELPPPPGPMRRSSHHDYAARKKGIEPVVWQGVFAVPSNAITGISEIDSRNKAVAELYGCVSKLLRVDHDKYKLDFLVGPLKPEVKKQLKENITQIRTECRKLRQEVISLGGRPLNEPMDYWSTTYYNASLL